MARPDSWYIGWDISEAERQRFREISQASREAKARSLQRGVVEALHPLYAPRFDPSRLMEPLPNTGRACLSLFSGGGGLDLGFERGGFEHVASYEILKDAASTLRTARPQWTVFGGHDGDVREVRWKQYSGQIDVVHGGPPCQPFSVAGRQRGSEDERDMFPQFVRAVLEIRPLAFVAENVPALAADKFKSYLRTTVMEPLGRHYSIRLLTLRGDAFGVPQLRKRIFFIGFRSKELAIKYEPARATHTSRHLLNSVDLANGQATMFEGMHSSDQDALPSCMGVRQAIGLPDIGSDALAPTIRSTLTGPRHTTSIVSSVAASKMWERLGIWPNGVAATRENARKYPAPNGAYRLCVADVALIQGFPETWPFQGAVYMALGQIGNAVPPPLAYQVAKSVAQALDNARALGAKH